jgi:hypothetical protein
MIDRSDDEKGRAAGIVSVVALQKLRVLRLAVVISS